MSGITDESRKFWDRQRTVTSIDCRRVLRIRKHDDGTVQGYVASEAREPQSETTNMLGPIKILYAQGGTYVIYPDVAVRGVNLEDVIRNRSRRRQ